MKEMPEHGKYPSILNLRPRLNERGAKIREDEFSNKDLMHLSQMSWFGFEKLDGTNIRFWVEDTRLIIRGRTDKAQLPAQIIDYFDERREHIVSVLPEGVTVYGEGVGPRIQSGGKYGQNRVIIFDAVTSTGRFLNMDTVRDLARQLKMEMVPLIQIGSLGLCETRVREGLKSQYGDFTAEGLVCRPVGGFLDAYGDRIITKIKARDYPKTCTGGPPSPRPGSDTG